VRPELDAVRAAADRLDAEADVRAAAEALEQRLDVAAAAARDGPPAKAPGTEHPMVVEEPDRVRRREVERALRRRRPQRRRERHEEVRAEPLRIAVSFHVLSE